MPCYDYLCRNCGKKFEILHKMKDPPPKHGPNCNKSSCDLEKQLAAPAAVFKSANPFVGGGALTPQKREAENTPKDTGHSCGSGCTYHRH